jgi:pimeloyl-ACP methyl ester carboxylesterase
MPTRDEPVRIAVGADECLDGTLVTPGVSMPAVLFVHGWGGSQQQYVSRARDVAALGCVCLTFDLRGHARTRQRNASVSREHNLGDVVAAYDMLVRQRGVDASAVAVVGSSYGGYLAAILASMRPVKWLALRAPALYKDSDWELPKSQLRMRQNLDAYRLLAVRPEESRALAACTRFSGDALIVESEHDDTVPHQVIVNYRDAFAHARSVTYRVITGADHGLTSAPCQQAYTSLLVNWLTEMVFGARAGSPPDAEHAVTGSKARTSPQPA